MDGFGPCAARAVVEKGNCSSMLTFRRKKSDLRQAIDHHLEQENVPADAPIRGVLALPGIEAQLEAFDRADRTALRKQQRYRRAGWLASLAAVLGVLIVPIELLPVDQWLPPWSPVLVNSLRGVTLFLTFVAIILLGLRRSAVGWKRSRGEAEKARANFFRKLIEAAGTDGRRLEHALACFKAAHMEWQIGFYKKRISELPGRIQAQTSWTAPFRLVGIALSVGAATLGVVTLLKYLAGQGIQVPYLTAILSWVPEPARWQHGLHGTAASLLAFAGARFLTHEDLSSAALYPWAQEELERVRGADLARAEASASSGNLAAVQEFRTRVQEVLDREHKIWATGVTSEQSD
jgi:hypothetical protein